MNSQNKFLVWILLATLITWGAWALVIVNTDPIYETEYSVNALSLSLFFLSLFPALGGSFTLLLELFKRNESELSRSKSIFISLRQGILLSLTSTACLCLLMLGLLRIWNGLLILAIITLIEFYFSTTDEL